jgi:copper chaperone CopZ
MKKLISLLFIGILFCANNVVAQTEVVKIKTSAQCETCKSTIEKHMNFEKGVKSAELDYKTKILTVSYDLKKTSPEKLRIAVTKSGYDADSLLADPKAYDKLRKCCKKGGH